jgi:outer membrane protein assembly factor BamB
MIQRITAGAQWLMFVATMVVHFGCTQAGGPDGWSQWGGPNRDFTTASARIATSWPEQGPQVVWSRSLGDGYSTIVADENMLYTMYRTPSGRPPMPSTRGKDEATVEKELAEWNSLPFHADSVNERIIALDPKTGETKWEHAYAAPYHEDRDGKERQTTQFGEGPNSTPLLIDGRVYTVGFTGIMHCLNVATGQVQWTKDLYNDLNGSFLPFGYAASPIAYGNTVITPVGGKGQGLVAFDQDTGDVVWKSVDLDCSYSSPMLVSVDGVDHLVTYMGTHVVGVSPETGEPHWSIEHRNQFDTSIITPVSGPDNLLFFVAGGDVGAKTVRLAKNGSKITPTEVWSTNKIKGGLHNPVRMGKLVYGDGGGSADIMVGFDISTGEIVWKERGFAKIKPVGVGRKLVILDEDGQLIVATPTAKGITVHAKAQMLEGPSWTAPTVVDGHAFMRDRKTIMAAKLTAK